MSEFCVGSKIRGLIINNRIVTIVTMLKQTEDSRLAQIDSVPCCACVLSFNVLPIFCCLQLYLEGTYVSCKTIPAQNRMKQYRKCMVRSI